MFYFVREFLDDLFIGKLEFSETIGRLFTALVLLAGFVLLAAILYQIFRFLFYSIVRIRLRRKENNWLQALMNQKFFARFAGMLPAFFVVRLVSTVFLPDSFSFAAFLALSNIYLVAAVANCLVSFMNALEEVMTKRKSMRGKPLRSYIQVVKVVVWTIAAILILCIIVNKSPAGLLAGIGAFSAVLLLVFQDTIMGFVYSIQLSTNDLIRVGDWITCGEADGTVEEINLLVVKVRNFDKTIISIPVKNLVTGSFQNWRGIEQKKMWRIKRSVPVDVNSIKPCTPEMLDGFRKIDLVKDFIAQKEQEIATFNEAHSVENQKFPNGNFLTNVEVFQAYMKAYLAQQPYFVEKGLLMVRQMDPEENGLPIQIYCFVNTLDWAIYEDLQSEYIAHFLAAMPYFELRPFQRNSDYKKM